MKEKTKVTLKKNLIGFLIGIITGGSISVIAATYFQSNDVTYDNSSSGLSSTNVQGAIDELYTECTTEKVDVGGIDVPIVDTGDGLYKDEYEDRYFYKGKNPNNYITFNDETAGWRIISIEADGSLKIMRDESIGNMQWDSSYSNDWTRPATLNTYLNGTYYNSLNSAAQSQIVSHDWSIGSVTYGNNDLSGQINSENSTKWNGKIALPTLSEYIRTNTNTSQCGTFSLNNSNYSTCKNTTWMFNSTYWWTLSPQAGDADYAFLVYSLGYFYGYSGVNYSYGVCPVVYLSSSVTLSGSGTSSDPYTIE